jgi:hypothetical protein
MRTAPASSISGCASRTPQAPRLMQNPTAPDTCHATHDSAPHATQRNSSRAGSEFIAG